MDFCWCTLTVSDMERSLDFYQNIVGLPLDRIYDARPGTKIAFLGAYDTKVELICSSGQKPEGGCNGVSLGFTVPSAEEKIKFLNDRGIGVDGKPVVTPSHKFFFIRDPDGYRVQFFEHT